MSEPTKICSDCKERKSWSKFWPAAKFADGSMRLPRSYCKACGSKRNIAANERRRRNRSVQRNLPAVDGERTVRLPIGPFREWLIEEIESRGSMAAVAELAGLQYRTLHRWLYEVDTVNLDLADCVFCVCDQPEMLGELFPELYEVAA